MLTITVAFANYGEGTREYPQSVHWPWSRCIHVDIGNDALRDPNNIHVARGVPKCVTLLVSRVKLFCILADQKLFCCNPRGHESKPRRSVEDTVSRSAGDSI
jgi:hypothetical protein